MRLDRTGLFCGLLIALACAAAPSAVLASPYDGQWTVTFVTNAGDCQPSATYPVVVTDGKITAIGAAEIAGKVNPNGLVRASLQGAHANGQLNGNSGSGKWNGASAGAACSGRWQASRN
ncbi:MAG: hypothetical protein WBA66_06975 [Xanthobacteraceae bacterium]